MLYVATDVRLPLTKLRVFAQGDFSFTGRHSLYDYQVGLLSQDLVPDLISMELKLMLGYREVKVQFEDLNNLYADLTFKGGFAGVLLYF